MSNLSIAYPSSYSDAVAMLKGKPRTKVGHNTWLLLQGSSVCLVYHKTAIVTYHAEHTKLDNGGYYSVTTKARLDGAMRALGIGGISQRKGSWYFTFTSGNELPYVNGQVFYTGCKP